MSTPDFVNDRELLVRIDEKTTNLQSQMRELKQEIKDIQTATITRSDLDRELLPLKSITYGFNGLVLTAFVLAMISRVIKKA